MGYKYLKKSVKEQRYTQQELGFSCIKPIKGEFFALFRDRSVYVSNKGRAVETNFQGRGYERELDKIDTGNAINILARRPHFNTRAERLHNMVAEVFLENPFNCKTVRFLDGDYRNCNVENLYYYHGRPTKAGKNYPEDDIFEFEGWSPFNIGESKEIVVKPSGILATTKKGVWNEGERLRRFETMHIKDTVQTVGGYKAAVVDGGGAVSTFELNNGRFALKTSWGSLITVRGLNQCIVEATDLTLVLEAIKSICTEIIKNETPMELEDVHIENIAFSMGGLKCSETTISLAA